MIHLLHVDAFRFTEVKKLTQGNVLQPLIACSYCKRQGCFHRERSTDVDWMDCPQKNKSPRLTQG